MPAPRPFGTGPYGTGYYSRYRGEIYEVGGLSLLSFGVTARPKRVTENAGLTSQLDFAAWALGLSRVSAISGVTQIQFDALSLGVTRIIHPEAVSQIVWNVWCEHLNDTWEAFDPCDPGRWDGIDGCLDGLWSPTEPCLTGGWTHSGAPLEGAWTAPAGCSSGVWSPRGLT